jgi:hypothetical protein
MEEGAATWEDVHDLELAMIELQPVEDLRRRAWSLREEYHAAIGDVLYNTYLHSLPSDLDSNETKLRSDLRRLLLELERIRVLERTQNRARAASLIWALAGLGLVFLVAIWLPAFVSRRPPSKPSPSGIEHWFILYWSNDLLKCLGEQSGCTGSLIRVVALFGGLGGLFSCMQRISSEQSVSVKSLETSPQWPLALASPTGAIGALVVYLIIRAGLVNGSLFPNLLNTIQLTEYAKLIVWSFIAGFSERFVPDALDWIASAGTAVIPGRPDATPRSSGAQPPGGEQKTAEAAQQTAGDEQKTAGDEPKTP